MVFNIQMIEMESWKKSADEKSKKLDEKIKARVEELRKNSSDQVNSQISKLLFLPTLFTVLFSKRQTRCLRRWLKDAMLEVRKRRLPLPAKECATQNFSLMNNTL